MSENPDRRNFLALERTRLANERTFLAYARTGLSLLAVAAILVEFFSKKSTYELLAAGLTIAGFFVLIFGFFRFYKVRNKLNDLDKTIS